MLITIKFLQKFQIFQFCIRFFTSNLFESPPNHLKSTQVRPSFIYDQDVWYSRAVYQEIVTIWTSSKSHHQGHRDHFGNREVSLQNWPAKRHIAKKVVAGLVRDLVRCQKQKSRYARKVAAYEEGLDNLELVFSEAA